MRSNNECSGDEQSSSGDKVRCNIGPDGEWLVRLEATDQPVRIAADLTQGGEEEGLGGGRGRFEN